MRRAQLDGSVLAVEPTTVPVNSHVLVSHNDPPTASIRALLNAMDRDQLSFNPTTGSGVVITGDDALNQGTVEYAALAPDLESAQA